MLIRKFEEQVARFPQKVAVKTRDKVLTYRQLDQYADCIAHAILEYIQPDSRQPVVSLLFEHGIHMITALMGVLKAGGIYVPLDNSFPEGRLLYMLEHSETRLILTNTTNSPLAKKLVQQTSLSLGRSIGLLDIEPLEIKKPSVASVSSSKIAYILYTSGSTGKPKGVYQTHENVFYYIRNWTRRFSITETDNMTLLTAFSHDGAAQDIFAALLNGAALFPYNIKNTRHRHELADFLINEQITIWHSIPTVFRYFVDTLTGNESFSQLRFILLGGESLRSRDAMLLKTYFPHSIMANVYGQTESSVTSIALITPEDTFKTVVIGEPLDKTRIFLVNDDGDVVEDFGTGEIVVACNHLAPGYWKDPEATRKSFTKEPDVGRLYWTGDLGGLMEDGRIELLGRKDRQVKIRGFRIELEEIESTLLQHSSVQEAIVTAREDKNKDNYLCAYVKGIFEKVPAGTILREYLLHTLPDYMIPSYFIQVEKMPLTPSGKVDRKALPSPESMESRAPYNAPRNEIEKELTQIWSGVLNLHQSSIGIDNNFFELGGHSLKAVTLSLKILQQLNVKLDLVEIFSMPSIRQLAQHIETAARNYYASLEEVEQREYYELSSAQKRMLILSQQEGVGTAYNIYKIFLIKGKVDKNRIESVFSALVRRHESLRTSFHIVEEKVFQKVHAPEDIEFSICYNHKEHEESYGQHNKVAHDMAEGLFEKFLPRFFQKAGRRRLQKIINNFFCPFELSHAPLLRVGLIKLEEEKHVLVYDMHHIISDGISIGIMIQDFIRLYQGMQLSSLRIQYKDFANWQNKLFQSDVMQQQEDYWHKKFNDEQGVPLLTMPLDYERPDSMTFTGDTITVMVTSELIEPLNRLVQMESVTLNILLLAIYTLLVSRYSGQEDVVIGSLVSGRPHPDLEESMGLFVNLLPIRIVVDNSLTFKEFLDSVKDNALEAYQNQDYPFEEMVKQTDLPVHPAINAVNPLFNTMFLFHSEADRTFTGQIENLEFHDIEFKDTTSTLDFKLDVYPIPSREPELYCRLEYNTNLFKKDTMEQLLNRFRHLMEIVTANPQQKLADFQVFTKAEEQQISQKRETFELDEKTKVQLGAAATFTAEPIKDYIVYWGNEYHMDIRVEFAPYNQVFQELVNTASLLSTNTGSHSVNLVLVRFEDWLRDNPGISEDETCEKLEKNFVELTWILRNRSLSVPLFTGVFPTAPHLGFSDSLFQYLEDLYQRWRDAVKTIDNTYLIDFTRLQSLYEVEEVFNPDTDREGHLPFSSDFYAVMGTYIARHIFAYHHQHYKVIALDCDNTIWKGICGEDGPEGVKIEGPWLELQNFILQRYRQGMLLVLCSKNNETDVWEVFAKNPYMPLKKDHFTAWRINWNSKSRNLEELAVELNLGIDTFIYVDDNPLECSEVMSFQPKVLTVQLPGAPEEIPMFLNHIWAFDRVKVTKEDEKRSRMYVTERKRKEIRESMPSLEEFIKSLELRVRMMPLKPEQSPRATQLTQRTNQFNLSTIRRSEGEILQLKQTPDMHCWILDISDRFGEYGFTGLVIAEEKQKDNCLFIDTLLLSCRVLGRNVENALVIGLANVCRKRNLSQLKAHYYPTAKNKPLLEFLQRSGWKKTAQSSDPDYTEFILPVKDIPLSMASIDFQFTFPIST